MKIQFKTYAGKSSKSRKGIYIQIRDEQGNLRSYKYKDDGVIDAYVQYFKDSMQNRRKASLGKYIESYIKPLSSKYKSLQDATKSYIKRHKGVKILDNLKKGKTEYTIYDVMKCNENEIRKAYKSLFRPLVLDNTLLNLLSLEENVMKIKERLSYNISFKNEKKTQFAESYTAMKKTLREVVNDLKTDFKYGMSIGDFSEAMKRISAKGYSTKTTGDKDILNNISITMRFRKSK